MPNHSSKRDDLIDCPQCGMKGTAQGVKHHYTTVHNDGQPGGLYIGYVPVVLELKNIRDTAAA